jgi:hypothetical protein
LDAAGIEGIDPERDGGLALHEHLPGQRPGRA